MLLLLPRQLLLQLLYVVVIVLFNLSLLVCERLSALAIMVAVSVACSVASCFRCCSDSCSNFFDM